jgi:hypothetical protein
MVSVQRVVLEGSDASLCVIAMPDRRTNAQRDERWLLQNQVRHERRRVSIQPLPHSLPPPRHTSAVMRAVFLPRLSPPTLHMVTSPLLAHCYTGGTCAVRTERGWQRVPAAAQGVSGAVPTAIEEKQCWGGPRNAGRVLAVDQGARRCLAHRVARSHSQRHAARGVCGDEAGPCAWKGGQNDRLPSRTLHAAASFVGGAGTQE